MNESAISTHQSGVIVTDGNERSALAVTRSLGRRGIPVFVGAETSSSLAGVSRYCRESFVYPAPWDSPDEFRACLLERAKRWGARVVFPMTDLAVEILGESEQRFGASIVLPIPPLDQYRALSDKYQLMESAKRQGVPIPDTIFVPDGDIEKVIPQIDRWPIVVKPGRSLLRVDERWIKTSVHFVSSVEELTDLYRRTPYLRNPSLIQQRIEGEGQGVFGLFDHGRPCALFAHRRIREKPPAGGVSVFRESIELSKPMVDYAVRLLGRVKWHGVAMVEFKVDRLSRIPILMEINGRFWGSLQLAIDAGLDFPYLLYQTMNGMPVAVPNNAYRIGTKSRWLLGDLDHLLLRLTKSNSELHLDPHAPSRGRCLAEFCKLFQHDLHYEVESLSDPGPALAEYRAWLSHLRGSRP